MLVVAEDTMPTWMLWGFGFLLIWTIIYVVYATFAIAAMARGKFNKRDEF